MKAIIIDLVADFSISKLRDDFFTFCKFLAGLTALVIIGGLLS